MKDLIIPKTEITPGVSFNASSGQLKIEGRAYSNDINLFYSDLNLWIDEYLKNAQPTTTITLQLDYYNSGFYKLLFILIVKCKKLADMNKVLLVKWRYQKDDEDSMEDAKEISAILDFPIELIEFD